MPPSGWRLPITHERDGAYWWTIGQAAVSERRRSEADLQLLENRIKHLLVRSAGCMDRSMVLAGRGGSDRHSPQGEDEKVQQLIAETRQRTEEVRSLKRRNAQKKRRAAKAKARQEARAAREKQRRRAKYGTTTTRAAVSESYCGA